mgnify:CR=1 FL=1
MSTWTPMTKTEHDLAIRVYLARDKMTEPDRRAATRIATFPSGAPTITARSRARLGILTVK